MTNETQKPVKFECEPLTRDEINQFGETQDWGMSLANITHAIGHLEESVPNGQIERTATNLLKLELHMKELRKWMEIRGVVEPIVVSNN
jgi:hypothetical protein